MTRKVVISTWLFLTMVSFLIIYQPIEAEEGLKKTTSTPVVDGAIEPGEYSYSIDINQMSLFLNRTSERLHVGLRAETEGWVGIGFKSKVMNKAEIVLGYVKDGKSYIFQHTARGRSHTEGKISYLISSEIRESSKITTLEVELSARDLIQPGQEVLPLVVAFGVEDLTSQYHKQRRGLEIKLID